MISGRSLIWAAVIGLLVLVGCSRANQARKRNAAKKSNTEQEKESQVERLREAIAEVAGREERKADEIEVQHLLVAHGGAGIPGVTRSLAEAEKETAALFARIEAGEDFDAMVKESTDDQHPGIYGMTMKGPGDRGRNIYPRRGMVPAFGNVGWKLDVGEVGVAPYSANESPYGYHIIKRLK